MTFSRKESSPFSCLLVNDQDEWDKELYRPIFEIQEFCLAIPGHNVPFFLPTAVSGQHGCYTLLGIAQPKGCLGIQT